MVTPSQPVGQTVSHYRILRKIGGSGMGVVYESEDLKLGRHVALKFRPEQLAHDAQALERFRREARPASAPEPSEYLHNSPNRPSRWSGFHCDGTAGGEDRQRLKGKPLEIETVLDVGIQMADALGAAHGKDIIHRDI